MELVKYIQNAETLTEIYFNTFKSWAKRDIEFCDLDLLKRDYEYELGKIEGVIDTLEVILNTENEPSLEVKNTSDKILEIWNKMYNKLLDIYVESKLEIVRKELNIKNGAAK